MLASDTLLQNRYLVVRPIGKGGMGAVYLAKDQRLRSTVALKETFFEDESMLKAFEREAALLANLRHPALPRVIDHFTEDQGQFLVMEFIPGEDLEAMLKDKGGAFSPTEVLGWADQLLDALDYLHTQEPQIIHRDIKPQNMKLTARGQIILLDFGLAKGSAGEMSKVGGSASVMGYTPTYAPLEQIHSTGTDPRSDLYSLAATLYHLITGTTPPDALFRASAVIGGKPDPLRPAHEINPQVSPAVSAVLARAMALHSEQRPATSDEMRRALNEAARFPVPISQGDMATVITAPGAAVTSPVNQATQMQESGVTVIDAPGDAPPQPIPPTAASPTAASPTAASPTLPSESPADPESSKSTPMFPRSAAAMVDSPARRTNRLPLLIGGFVMLLVVAGVVIALIAANNNSGAADSGSNKASTANAQSSPGADNVNAQTKQQPASQSGKSESSSASQTSKPEPNVEKKPETRRPAGQSPAGAAAKEALKKRVESRPRTPPAARY
jgi:serine/threonine protein kinase